jgi:hypothetical protein
VPARRPPQNPAIVATIGLTPITNSVAAMAAPSGKDPSAVMSGKLKMRKLINTPNARKERISPIVRDPMSKVMVSF